jgi:hypothetical protein
MAILLASELSFSTPVRCPRCGVGLLAYGKGEPFAVDAAGAVYCRNHGAEVDATYRERHAAWEVALRQMRLDAVRALEADEPAAVPLSAE